MKRFSEQFNKAAQQTTLSKAERADLKDRLISYMEYHPLPAEMKSARPVASGLSGESFRVFTINTLQFRAAAMMLGVMVLIVVPFAAERAVPGEVLYGVKVNFNEEVRSTLAVSSFQKVEWETKRIERRLAEARLLASEGKLTDVLEAEVAAAVTSHSNAAQAEIALIRETDSEEAAIAEITFASALEVESEVLEVANARNEAASTTQSVAIAAAIADAQAGFAANPTAVSYGRLLAKVESETTRAYELLASIRETVSTNEVIEVERRLGDVERKIAEAIRLATPTPIDQVVEGDSEEVVSEAVVTTETASSTEAGTSTEATVAASSSVDLVVPEEVSEPQPVIVTDEAAAIILLRQALQDTQKLMRFMTDLDLKESVAIDSLVPTELTDGERQVQATANLKDLERLQGIITQEYVVDEKVDFALSRVAELTKTASSSFVAKEYVAALQASTEALSVANEALEMIRRVNQEKPPPDIALDTAGTEAVAEEEESVTELEAESLESTNETE